MLTLLTGADSYRRRLELDAQLDALVPRAKWPHRVVRLDSRTLSAADVGRHLDTVPLFGDLPVLIVEDAGDLSREALQALWRRAGDPAVALFLDYGTAAVPALARPLAAGAGTAAGAGRSRRTGGAVRHLTVEPLEPDALARWLRQQWQQHGAQPGHPLSLGVARELVGRLGTRDAGRAWQELERLGTLASGRALVVADLEAMAAVSAERTPWIFTDAFVRRDTGRALDALGQLERSGGVEGLWVLADVRSRLFDLTLARAAWEAEQARRTRGAARTGGEERTADGDRPGRGALSEALGTWRARRALEAAPRWPRPSLTTALDQCHQADRQMKRGALPWPLLQALTLGSHDVGAVPGGTA